MSPLPIPSRKVRLTLAVVGLFLIVCIQWAVTLRSIHWNSEFWKQLAGRPLGYALIALFIYSLRLLGLEEEKVIAEADLDVKVLLARIIVPLLLIVGGTLVLFFSFFTDSPFTALFITVAVVTVYLMWKKGFRQLQTLA
jgi:hypothetical protein